VDQECHVSGIGNKYTQTRIEKPLKRDTDFNKIKLILKIMSRRRTVK
jgi:hypothetical protein